MDIIENVKPLFCDTVAALGYFDGVHIGHRSVIAAAVAAANRRGTQSAVLTFDMSTMRAGGKGGADLMLSSERRALIEELGVSKYVELKFEDIAGLSTDEFVGRILGSECLSSLEVCCGEDFRFGVGRSGGVETLRELCYGMDIEVHTVGSVEYDGAPVSTSRIKKCVAEGDMEAATTMLGHPYGFELPVVTGRQLAGRLGFPTVNQRFPEGISLPRFGVYRSHIVFGERTYNGVTNVGVRPTVDSTGTVMIETHILDFKGDLYGKKLRTELVSFMRDEKHFAGDAELRARVTADIEKVRELCGRENTD